MSKRAIKPRPMSLQERKQHLAEECLRLEAVGKQAYEGKREALRQLRAIAAVDEEIPLSEAGAVFVIVDQFAEKDVVWKPAGVERFAGIKKRAGAAMSKL